MLVLFSFKTSKWVIIVYMFEVLEKTSRQGAGAVAYVVVITAIYYKLSEQVGAGLGL